MTHHFDVNEATLYGVESAILLANIRFWLANNKANKVNAYDGYYWTYNSARAFSELFPYMTARSISRYLKNLCDLGVLVAGNYNKTSYDHTLWYTIPSEFEVKIDDNRLPKTRKSSGQNDESTRNLVVTIPDNKTQILNTDSKLDIVQSNRFEEFWQEYPKKKAKEACKKIWDKLNPDGNLIQQIVLAVINSRENDPQWTSDGGQFIPMPSTYLNQKRWEDELVITNQGKTLNDELDASDWLYEWQDRS